MRILLGPTTTCQARDTGRRPLWSDVRHYLALSRIAATSVATCGRIEIGGRWLDAGRLLLWVEDWGAGVAAEDLPHVFEPFFTTKRAGTGLGLAIARKVVEALGGSIRMESRLGQGTRVEIRLKTAPGRSGLTLRLTPP